MRVGRGFHASEAGAGEATTHHPPFDTPTQNLSILQFACTIHPYPVLNTHIYYTIHP